jgi:hypothetical protein
VEDSGAYLLAGPLGIYLNCNADPNCGGIPQWEQALLGVVGCAIAFAILYGLYRLIMRFSAHGDPPKNAHSDDD